jgi:phenylacetate-CoA ligase
MRALNRAYLEMALPFFEPRSFRGVASRFRKYERLEKLSLVENRTRQWEALQRLLLYSYENCSFYRRWFEEAGIHPSSIQSTLDLQKLPVLTRNDIAHRLDELQSRGYKRSLLLQAATGGTTDTPVPILRSPSSVYEKAAVQLRFNAWAGFLPGDKVFYLWGARQDYSENPSWRWRLFDRHLMRRVWAPTSILNPQVLESHRRLLNELRPSVVYAYPTPLTLFCEYLKESGLPFHRPASTICTAEPLFPEQRVIIEEVLRCRVFEHYGSREFGMIAGECEQHKGMHLNPAGAYLEFLPVESSETPGLHEMLVTDLLNYGMPLIRYRVNDCVLTGPEECGCERGYPLIRQIIGRTGDVFQLPNGDRIPGVAFTNRVLKVCPGLAKTQIIQESLTEFRIRYVPGRGFSVGDLDMLRANLRRFVPEELRWTFEEVREIPRESSGKTRFCISRLSSARPPIDAAAQGNKNPR